MTPRPQRIALTGASAGLGAALARELAAPGVELFLCARTAGKLEEVAQDCRKRGATVTDATVDLTDRAKATAWVAAIQAEGPIDLLVLNAGVFAGRATAGHTEPLDAIEAMVATNLAAPLVMATAAVSAMRARGAGHIVFVSSLAARSPVPDAPGYSATKAGLSAFGRALADDLHGTGVVVTLIEPGHIRTHQTEQQQGAVPMALAPDVAARRILRAIQNKQTRTGFPLPAWLWVRITDVLPRRMRLRLNRSQRFTVRNDPPKRRPGG